jgi:glycosyltransferase involved in cell wall biosynthesis
MRILFVCKTVPPKIDGVGDYTWNLAHEFAKRGFTVFVACLNDSNLNYENSSTVKLLPIVKSWTFTGTRQLVENLRVIKPEWILFQYVPFSFQRRGIPIRLPSLISEWRKHSKVLIFFHEPFIRFKLFPFNTLALSSLQRWVAFRLCQKADKIVTSIDLYKSFLSRFSRKDIEVIPVGSNILSENNSDGVIEALRSRIAPNGEKIISTFGVRDHFLLIKVFKEILQQRNDCRLLICGEIANISLYGEIAGYTYITGYLPSPQIYDYLRTSDLFILPDPLYEGKFGGTSNKSTTLAAALAAGLPVIGVRGDMNNNLLKKVPELYLINTNDMNSIVQVVNTVLKRNRRENANNLFWKQNLSWEVIANQFVKILN